MDARRSAHGSEERLSGAVVGGVRASPGRRCAVTRSLAPPWGSRGRMRGGARCGLAIRGWRRRRVRSAARVVVAPRRAPLRRRSSAEGHRGARIRSGSPARGSRQRRARRRTERGAREGASGTSLAALASVRPASGRLVALGHDALLSRASGAEIQWSMPRPTAAEGLGARRTRVET